MHLSDYSRTFCQFFEFFLRRKNYKESVYAVLMDPSLSRGDIALVRGVVRATLNLIMISQRNTCRILFKLCATWFRWSRNTYDTDKYISRPVDVPFRTYVEFYAILLRYKWHQEWETSSDHAFPIFFLCEKLRLSVGISHFAPPNNDSAHLS